MAGYNFSLYLKNEKEWDQFKTACKKAGKKPNTILRNFIASYCETMLRAVLPLEKQIAMAMIEAKKIATGEINGQSAHSLLKELKEEAKKDKVKTKTAIKHTVKKAAKKKLLRKPSIKS